MPMAAGFAAGIGAGLAIGVATGTKQTREKLGQYFETEGLTLLNPQGQDVEIDEALDNAMKCGETKNKKALLVLLGLGVVTLLIGLAVYVFVAQG